MIEIKKAVPCNPDFRFREPVSLSIGKNEHIAFVGPNGGGKSMLARMLAGNYPLKEGRIDYGFSPSPVYRNIKFIAFKDNYGPADSSYYLQQRWNSQDRDVSPLVRDVLERSLNGVSDSIFFELFGIDEMLEKQMVSLSSGEMRKFQLTKALLSHPRILIIDNPFIGLDAATRGQLYGLLNRLAGAGEVQVMLILAKTDEIPGFITHVVPVEGMLCKERIARGDFAEIIPEAPHTGDLRPPEARPAAPDFYAAKSDMIIEMRDVSIKYGTRTILDSLSWTVRRGEKWALLGRNGSGKSTLLSLVCADNPQSYACDISLFGRRRGSGESIWDIKKRIGYVSPEMHRSCSVNIPAIEIVAGGLHDSIGFYVSSRPEHLSACEWWMNLFGISALKERRFLQLSDGEQRLVLLARAFVKDPELLILDEPFHGLDTKNRLLVKAIIESFCNRPGKTLIMVTHYEQELPGSITNRLVLEKTPETQT
ncbi:MAG: ATP-binding cassette domain-containing protein [Tannerella sp.]|jgi:molybdate transport system ATP-binding protein|nr:ATP-binding cassette domain-containing protein [Tannerella sp.]